MVPLFKLLGVILGTTLGLLLLTRYDADWQALTHFCGYPVIAIAQEGARGLIAVGQVDARGVLVIAQAGFGLVTFAQGGAGLLFGVGQLMVGLVVIGQLGLGLLFFLGQVGAGLHALGQGVLGRKAKDLLGEMNEELGELLCFR